MPLIKHLVACTKGPTLGAHLQHHLLRWVKLDWPILRTKSLVPRDGTTYKLSFWTMKLLRRHFSGETVGKWNLSPRNLSLWRIILGWLFLGNRRLRKSFVLTSWKRKWQPTPVFLPGEFHRQRSLEGYSPWGHKQSDMTERLTLSLTLELWFIPSHHPHSQILFHLTLKF